MFASRASVNVVGRMQLNPPLLADDHLEAVQADPGEA
jgi:hypothetical protein